MIKRGDIVSFDCDLIGPAGYLPISRAPIWSAPQSPRRGNNGSTPTLRHSSPRSSANWRRGTAFDEAGERLSRRFPAEYHAQRYPFIAPGSGLADEYRTLLFANHHEGEIEKGMVLSGGLRRRRGRGRGFEA